MPNVLSTRDLVSRSDNMDETVLHNSAEHELLNAHKYQNRQNH